MHEGDQSESYSAVRICRFLYKSHLEEVFKTARLKIESNQMTQIMTPSESDSGGCWERLETVTRSTWYFLEKSSAILGPTTSNWNSRGPRTYWNKMSSDQIRSMLIKRTPPPLGFIFYVFPWSNPEEEDPLGAEAPGTNSSRGVLFLRVLDQGT